jgi:nucleoside-diphosphate kinase
METTLVLLKPDCHQGKHIGEVIGRFEKTGLEICGCKMLEFSLELLRIHYAHILHLPVFPKLAEYMQSTPVIALALKGEDCVGRVRGLVGPTDSTKAQKGTIRGDLGESNMKNVVHASDSKQNAEIELKRFFSEDEIFAF